MSWVICLLAGAGAGFAGGLFGISGGIVIVPILVLALRFSQHKAQGSSLLALAFPAAALGALNYYGEGQASVPLALVLAFGFSIGHSLGGRIANRLDALAMRWAFAGFLTLLALFLFSKDAMVGEAAFDAASPLPAWIWPATLAIAAFAGTLGGLFGFGGGIVSVPIMVMALGLSQHFVQGTTLVALTLPITAFSAHTYHRKGNADTRTAIPLAVGLLAGGYIGSVLAFSLDPVTMQRSFCALLVALAAYLFLRKT